MMAINEFILHLCICAGLASFIISILLARQLYKMKERITTLTLGITKLTIREPGDKMINDEFEQYWASALDKVQDKTIFARGPIKEFCRQMFIDIAVDKRCYKHEIENDRTGISSE